MIEIYTNESLDVKAETLDLGRVEMGKKIKYTVFIKNPDIQWPIANLSGVTENKELEFDLPNIIKPNEVAKAYIYWTPKVGSKKPLEASFKISGDLLIG